MNWVTGILVYVIIWWLIFFMALPFGVKPTDNPHVGHEPSAPANPMLLKKALITSLISAILWGVAFYIITNKLITIGEADFG
ncbi:DUF1467 family protein [Kiloniella laminariae]|uniref:DUF1467 family protein n=1 Tax=Kiloniella laminariae TaxID=454162 RepID=A0ABT4LNX7_9PROT|nr:DUF1467 family protein [Kiloniella laminariae]MCZ4282016.1 DUF1467 family protein [Kiloniella laminariae]